MTKKEEERPRRRRRVWKRVKRWKEMRVLNKKGKLLTTKTWLGDLISKMPHLKKYGLTQNLKT